MRYHIQLGGQTALSVPATTAGEALGQLADTLPDEGLQVCGRFHGACLSGAIDWPADGERSTIYIAPAEAREDEA